MEVTDPFETLVTYHMVTRTRRPWTAYLFVWKL